MQRGKRINIRPIDDMCNQEFKDAVKEMMSFGINECHAGCYICNYHDRYICNEYNGGCKCKSKCEEIYEKLKNINFCVILGGG